MAIDNNQGVFDRPDGKREALKDSGKRGANEEVDDLVWMMSCPDGRRIMNRLLERTGVFQTSFDQNPLQMAFAEGQRNIGLRFLAMVQANCKDYYVQMLKEAEDDRRNRQQQQ